MIPLTIRPALIVQSPRKPWAVAVTVSGPPGIHYTPSYDIVANGRWTPIGRQHWPFMVHLSHQSGRQQAWLITSHQPGPPAFQGISYLRLVPQTSTGHHNTGVAVAPAVSLFIGHRSPVRGQMHWSGSPFAFMGSISGGHLALRNTGHTWWLPQPRITVNGYLVAQSPLTTPLLPGQALTRSVPIPLPLGWDTVRIVAPGVPPITTHVVSLPGVSLGVGLGLFVCAEGVRLVSHAQKKRIRKRSDLS